MQLISRELTPAQLAQAQEVDPSTTVLIAFIPNDFDSHLHTISTTMDSSFLSQSNIKRYTHAIKSTKMSADSSHCGVFEMFSTVLSNNNNNYFIRILGTRYK
jgi:hypothetical protein